MARTTSAAMQQLMELSGAQQAQIERWQKKGFLPRFPRAFQGGGGSRSVLTDEIVDRARHLVRYARQGAAAPAPISLIATLSEPDVGLLRAAVLDGVDTIRRRAGGEVRGVQTAEEAATKRWIGLDRRARRAGLSWALRDFEEGPVKDLPTSRLVDLMTVIARDSDEEITSEDLNEATWDVLQTLKLSGPGLGDGVFLLDMFVNPPPGLDPALRKAFSREQFPEVFAHARRLLMESSSHGDMRSVVEQAPEGLLVRACRVVPAARRTQMLAIQSARIAVARQAGDPTLDGLREWADLGMTYESKQRMTCHPMWLRWGMHLSGGVTAKGDAVRIVSHLQYPQLLADTEEYIVFLLSLMPPEPLQRILNHDFPDGASVETIE
ncbi:hypothetical protein ACFT0G_06060 [Streptomyces sp. NPDC057020]|uniref:hypothetical protein n=1 Tax=unclassified Streptomyces TaxID=2593676 RepID=UPI003624EA07